jgi:hypothetical protein
MCYSKSALTLIIMIQGYARIKPSLMGNDDNVKTNTLMTKTKTMTTIMMPWRFMMMDSVVDWVRWWWKDRSREMRLVGERER